MKNNYRLIKGLSAFCNVMCQEVRVCWWRQMSVQCLTMRQPPPPACRAGGAAGSWTARGPPAGLGRHNLAVNGTQQQHQTHGSKHLAGTRPRDLQVQHHCCHWGEQNICQQQTKRSLRGAIITEFMLTNEVFLWWAGVIGYMFIVAHNWMYTVTIVMLNLQHINNHVLC